MANSWAVKRDYRILIVEDDPIIQEVAGTFLGDAFLVEIVGTQKDALERLARQDKPNVNAIVLDLMLPNGSGVEVVRGVQLRFPAIPIVVITGMEFTSEQVIESGAQEFLSKPFTAKELIRAVSSAIARHRVRWMFAPIDQELAGIKQELKERDEARVTGLARASDQMPKP